MNIFMYIICTLIWGLNFIAVKIQGTETSLEASLLYRSIIAFALFYILFKIKSGKIVKNPVNLIPIIGFGLCNFAISYLLLYYGTIYSTAAMVTLIFSLKAVITPIFIGIAFKTKIHKKVYIGGFLGLMSVFVILYPNLTHLSSHFVLGIILALIGTLITSIGDTLSTLNNKNKIDPLTANTIGMFAAIIIIGVISLVFNKDMHIPLSFHYWAGLLYLAIFASFIAWLFYLHLVKNIGASESSYMVALFPAIGGVTSVLMGESELTINLILGILLAMIGAFIALTKKKTDNTQ